MSYKSDIPGWRKFLIGLLCTIIILAVLGTVCYILYFTIPSVHDFFVSSADWVKNLFIGSKEVVSDTKAIIDVIKN